MLNFWRKTKVELIQAPNLNLQIDKEAFKQIYMLGKHPGFQYHLLRLRLMVQLIEQRILNESFAGRQNEEDFLKGKRSALRWVIKELEKDPEAEPLPKREATPDEFAVQKAARAAINVIGSE